MIAHRKPVLSFVMLALFGTSSLCLRAQEINIAGNTDKPLEERLIYNRQNTFFVSINNRGFSGGFRIGKIKNIYTTRQWECELTSIHSMKEIKTVNTTEYRMRPYVYGKLNSVFALRFGYGAEKRIYGKPYWGGVEMRWTYEAGASLAFQKPYYYYVIVYQMEPDGGYTEVIDEQTFDDKAQWRDILGRSSFFKGFDKLTLSPGIHAKTGFSFDFSSSRTSIKAVNVGAVAEYFPLGVSVMDSEHHKMFFLTFYVSYNWGSRFNR